MSVSVQAAIPTWGSPTLEGLDLENAVTGVRVSGKGRQYVRFYKKKFVQVYATDVHINPVTGSTKVLSTGTREVEREFVEIVTPGDKNTFDDFAEDYHRRTYWKQYKAFRDNEGAMMGKDLDLCSYVPGSIATELKYRGCHTEEQLADASDFLCGQVANGFDLREFARAMVKAETENSNQGQVGHLRGELLKAQTTISALMEEQEKMKTMLLDMNGRPVESSSEEVERRPTKTRKIITEEVV